MALSNALHTKEITTAQVTSVSFGFFSAEEIRKISVKQVVSPIIFDNLKNPIKGGLYDPAYGPLDSREKCATCSLTHFECPGHFGHVELSVPLYNPLVFITLYKLLRCTCLHCFKFRMAGGEVERFRRRLELLSAGRLVEAQALVLGSSAAAKKAGGEMIDEMLAAEAAAAAGSDSDGDGGGDGAAAAAKARAARDALDYDVTAKVGRSGERAARGRGPRDPAVLTAQTLEAMIDTIGELFRKQPAGKCQNCGAHSPAIRREGFSKLFALPLPPKKRAANSVQGTPVLSVLHRLGEGGQAVAQLEEELGAGERHRAASRKRHRDPAPQLFPGPAPGDDTADETKSGGVKGEDAKDDKDGASSSGEEGEEESDEAADSAAAAAAAGQGAGASGGLSGDSPTYLTPTEVREVMRRFWELNEPLLAYVYPADVARRQRRRAGPAGAAAAGNAAARRAQGYLDFFVQTVPVAPNRFRPANKVGEIVYEHPQNTLLSKLVNGDLDLLAAGRAPQEGAAAGAGAAGATPAQSQLGRTLRLWLDMQNSLNALLDSSAADDTHGVSGIRQQLEKKEGLFRKNMMGKRVNFACRSVISPDVYLNGGEIGVPPYFASRLSFPERVTPWNVARLQEAVMAGPGRNPGAVAVEDERGRIVMLRKDKTSREAVAKTLLGAGLAPAAATPGKAAASAGLAAAAAATYGGGKVVYRTMTDGDFMLTNRQPTLHKPGMMGHRARIMRAERTIRFHYANCATFNADFDGDEINLHLPQDHLGRAEGYDIVHADEQFFVPTDGKPLRGLIQDHIVAGTLLTMKDCFLTQAQFCQLVYECVAPDCSGAWDVWLPPPAVLRPARLWTGKQVFTAALMHYTRDQLPFSMSAASKVPVDAWGGPASGEGRMHVWRNHLVAGCVDKATFGKHGFLHIFHELYGAERTSIVTAALSRLFTAYLQQHGFTCGMADVLLVGAAEAARAALLAGADVRALEAAAAFAGTPGPGELLARGATPEEAFAARERAARSALGERFRSGSSDAGVALDMKMSGAMHPLSSEVVKACLPGGQARPFRHNMMALMTITGAKGSVVNFSQISCLLGQQELEGRRVPRMASGKTLPCFAPHDAGARSGGFVGDRFLSGLRPQEYYFHCMAGREGLVDTTVKTSRSGYLQRCMVKNLEPLRVGYDATVRDDCDGSVVQFVYGEDGVDPTQAGCLRTLPLLFYNSPQFAVQVEAAGAAARPRLPGQAAAEAAARAAVRARAAAVLAGDAAAAAGAPPVNAALAQTVPGVTSEGFQDALTDALFGGGMLPPNPGGLAAAYKAADKRAARAARKGLPPSFSHLDPLDFQTLMHTKFYRAQAAPGEAVGVVAAQSVGEPSTQMTLNTFHMAGRGEANVTLGIPRLREILMTAAAAIKTPVMTLPLAPGAGAGGAAQLAVRLKRVRLAEALKALRVEENVVAGTAAGEFGRGREYTARLQFHPPSAYPPELGITFEEIAACFTRQFLPRLQAAVKAEVKKAAGGGRAAPVAAARVAAGGEEGAPAELEDEAAAPAKRRRSDKDDAGEDEEEDAENEEGKRRFGGGGAERATYDAGDAEDRQIERDARAAAARRDGDDDDDDDSDGDASADEEDEGAAAATAKPKPKGKKGGGGGGAPAGDVDEAGFTCVAVVTLALDDPKLLMRELVERVAAATVMRGVPGIAKCYVLDAAARGGAQVVQTDGINIHGAWESCDLLDADRLTTNNPAAMLATFGVEAARATVVAEVTGVFGAYGIAVDPRHLSLIADHMTHAGGYRACNRTGIEASTSPFLKITFETAAAFLVSATLHGDVDPLTSPAARIVLGQPVRAGTGSMDLIQRLGAKQAAQHQPSPVAAA